MARGLSEQPPVVLSDAQARRRAHKGVGRLLPGRMAIRGDGSQARGAAARLDRSAFARQGEALRSNRRHRAPLRGARSAEAPGLLSLCRSGRGALRARRRARAAALLPFGRGAGRPAPARDNEHALRFPRVSAKRRTAVQRAPAYRDAAPRRGKLARGREPSGATARGAIRERPSHRHHRPARRRGFDQGWARCRSSPTRSTTCGERC